MSVRVYAKHPPYNDGRLGEVALDMEHAGTPTIRCVTIKGDFYAIEGSHRLALAGDLQLTPKLIVLEPDLPGHQRIPQGLPVYVFEHALALYETDFTQ